MKKMKRIVSILMVLSLMLNFPYPAQAAEDTNVTLSMTASAPSIQVGETVNVTIGVDNDFASRGSGMTVYYDDTVLEPDLAGSSAAEPFRIDAVTVKGQAALRISFLPGLEAAEFTAAEALTVLSFKALSASEQTIVHLDAAYFYDEALMEIPVNKPEAISLMVEPSEVYVPVTGITLDTTELTLEEGEMAALKATVQPAEASDTTVQWTSSDETVVIVSDGVVKALTAGSAVITATTGDGGFAASCTVTVTPPDAGYTVKMPGDITAVIGGTVRIPVEIGNGDGQTGYNAFDISFTYDPDVLELMSTEIPGVTVTVSSGKIHVLGYGENRNVNTVPFALEFRTMKMENTQVRISDARVDNSGNAAVKNASLATVLDDATEITIAGYPVTLPDGFSGAGTAQPGAAYTFSEPDDYYDYDVTVAVGGTKIAVTNNGDGSYTIPGDQVTGEIVVTAVKTGKTFQVTLGTDMTGAATAQYGTDYEATLNRDDDYSYAVTVTIGGREYTGYGIYGDVYRIPGEDIIGDIVFQVVKTVINNPPEPTDPSEPTDPTRPTEPDEPTEPSRPTEPDEPTEPSRPTEPDEPTEPSRPTEPDEPTEPSRPTEPDEPTEPSRPTEPDESTEPSRPTEPDEPTEPSRPTEPDEPTEPSEPTVPAPPVEQITYHSVTFSGSGAGAAQGNATSVAHGSDYTLTLKKQTGYSYQVSYKMGGKPAVKLFHDGDGIHYTVVNVTAPLEIIIEKTLNIQLSVHEFVTLDEKSVFLILADAVIGSGNIFTYDGNAMYYSEAYGAWAYLVVTDGKLDQNSIRSLVKITAQTDRTMTYSGYDVDRNGFVDWNDVQLVQDLYNAQYEAFDTIHMSKFLNADVNGDRRVDVRDAARVVWAILESEEERT